MVGDVPKDCWVAEPLHSLVADAKQLALSHLSLSLERDRVVS